ncbi:amidohydrolase family protein [Pararhizobium mangrovi]|nr:amidohydrolase family protein [Pararhizobium mangrovi]
MGSIDVHTHFIPQTYLNALADIGVTEKQVGFPLQPWDIDARLAVMDRQGIDTEVISLSSPSMRFWHGDDARMLTRKLNEELAAIVRDRPARFGGFATLPLPDVDGALAEIGYAFDELGLDGAVLMTNYGGTYLGNAKFAPVLDELNRRGAVLFVHPTEPPESEILTQGFPAPAFEYPADTTRTVASLIDGDTAKRCPGLKIIVSHGGGTIPFLKDRLELLLPWKWDGDPQDGAERVTSTLDSLYYDLAIVGFPASLAAIEKTHDVSRLLTGYDLPFVPEKALEAGRKNIEAFGGFSDDDRTKISFANAQTLFPRLAG